jgi:hypothetical protein
LQRSSLVVNGPLMVHSLRFWIQSHSSYIILYFYQNYIFLLNLILKVMLNQYSIFVLHIVPSMV